MSSFPVVALGRGGVSRQLMFGESIPEALGLSASEPASHAWLSETPEGVQLTQHNPKEFTSSVRLPIAYKEASPQALASAPPLPPAPPPAARDTPNHTAAASPPPVRLAVAVVAGCTVANEIGVAITRRLRFVQQQPTWNGLWVFPGGGVHVGETLHQACVREYQEETGLPLDAASLVPLALWQAGVPAQHKQYLIVIFGGRVDEPALVRLGGGSSAVGGGGSSASNAGAEVGDMQGHVQVQMQEHIRMQASEVGAVAFLPTDRLHQFTDHWLTGPEEKERAKQESAASGAATAAAVAGAVGQQQEHGFLGWELSTEGAQEEGVGTANEVMFTWPEMEGDGGEKSGVGGAHRFGIRHYLQHLAALESQSGL